VSKHTTIDRLRRKLDSATNKLNRLEQKRYPGDEMVEHFHMGLVGGSGKPSRELNKRKAAALDHIIDDAKEKIRLRAMIGGLERKIDCMMKNPPPHKSERIKRNPARTPKPVSPVLNETYHFWARGLWEDMETRLSAARSRFVQDAAWDNLDNQAIRGEMHVYIEVQATINCQHLRGKEVTIDMLVGAVRKEQAKAERQANEEPDKAWIQASRRAHCATADQIVAFLTGEIVPS